MEVYGNTWTQVGGFQPTPWAVLGNVSGSHKYADLCCQSLSRLLPHDVGDPMATIGHSPWKHAEQDFIFKIKECSCSGRGLEF